MNQKVDSIVLRIRNLERRLMDKKFVGGLSVWNPLLELQALIQVRQIPNDGDFGGWCVVLPTKDCIDILNRLGKVKTKDECDYLLYQLNDLAPGKIKRQI